MKVVITMIERLETQIPSRPETRVPHKTAYEIKRFFAFLLDPLFELPGLAETNSRIELKTLNRLRELLGDRVDILEEAIVKNRWKSLLGIGAKIFGQTGMTAALSVGNITPDLYTQLFGELFTMTATGDILDDLNRDRAYREVRRAASKVAQHLKTDYSADIYSLKPSEKQNLVASISDAIAKGESLARPLLTTAVYSLLNSGVLFATNRIGAGAFLSILEMAILAPHIQHYLSDAGKQKQLLESGITLVSDAIATDSTFNTTDAENAYLSTSNTPSGEHSKAVKAIVLLLSQVVLPIYAIGDRGEVALALTQAGQLGSHQLPLYLNEREFAAAQTGNALLKRIINLIEDTNLSLTTEERWQAHCDDVRNKKLGKVEFDKNSGAVVVIGPFSIRYPRKQKPHLTLNEPLELKAGKLYYLRGRSGGGESTFLQAITQMIRTIPTQESVVAGDNDIPVGVHDLDSVSIKKKFKYVHPETPDSKLSPLVLFSKYILALRPEEFNPYIFSLIKRYRNDGILNTFEQKAMGYVHQLLSGFQSELEISNNVLGSDMSSVEKSVVLQLLPYARLSDAKKELIHKLSGYPFFTEEDFEELVKFDPNEPVKRPLRAKLRITKILEDAEISGTRVLAIDNTLDPLTNEDTSVIISYLEKWCESHQTALLIATTQDFNKNALLKSSQFENTIYFSKDGTVKIAKTKDSATP